MTIKVAPSLLSADFSRLAEEIGRCEAAGAAWIHFDVMDGSFVPNLTFGAPVIRCCRGSSRLPFDVHLMIDRPDRYLDDFLAAGADLVTVHVESPCDGAAVVSRIRAAGRKAGVSLRPGTPLAALDPFLPAIDLVLVMSVEPGFGGQAFRPDAVERVRALDRSRRANGFGFEISVDGGIDDLTAPLVVAAGADVLVAGNYLFRHPSFATAVAGLAALGR